MCEPQRFEQLKHYFISHISKTDKAGQYLCSFFSWRLEVTEGVMKEGNASENKSLTEDNGSLNVIICIIKRRNI